MVLVEAVSGGGRGSGVFRPAVGGVRAGHSWYLLAGQRHALRVWAVSFDATIFEKGKGKVNDRP